REDSKAEQQLWGSSPASRATFGSPPSVAHDPTADYARGHGGSGSNNGCDNSSSGAFASSPSANGDGKARTAATLPS
ncbi:hypothetical protein S245_037198, partial [Arachis hypogaea]